MGNDLHSGKAELNYFVSENSRSNGSKKRQRWTEENAIEKKPRQRRGFSLNYQYISTIYTNWRREGDSNPRYTFEGIHTISSRAP